jgi:aminoglycoside 3-N-acetyltransferase
MGRNDGPHHLAIKKMSIAGLAKRILPAVAYESIVRKKKERERSLLARLPKLSEAGLTEILTGDLRLTTGDVVFVHSSLDQLNLDFPFYRVLTLLRNVIGPEGTMLFPTYPNHRISSYEYLLQGKVFDVKRTPSYAGLLTEFARKHPDAVRSLHPTKSVCAIGPLAGELTSTHQNSRYPYDAGSPFYKLTEHEGRIVGLGVWTSRLSFAYCVDDAMKEEFPARVYHDRVFAVPCIDYDGKTQIVETYAHNMRIIEAHEGPNFFRTHIANDACADLTIKGMKFFRVDARTFFDDLLALAKQGITVYPRSVYGK